MCCQLYTINFAYLLIRQKFYLLFIKTVKKCGITTDIVSGLLFYFANSTKILISTDNIKNHKTNKKVNHINLTDHVLYLFIVLFIIEIYTKYIKLKFLTI